MRILALAALVATASAACSDYCTLMAANCASVFASTQACMDECAAYAQTTQADTLVDAGNALNNLGCREYHAGAPSQADPTTHCPHARPDSTLCRSAEATAAGLTSGTCDNYCDQLRFRCFEQDSLLGADATGARAACINACKFFSDQDMPMGSYPVPASKTGDLGCRRYHLTVAMAPANTVTHCPHADLLGGNGVCGGGCFNFCQVATAGQPSCVPSQTLYENANQCQQICRNFPLGNPPDKAGDTLYCRAYHLSVALRGTNERTVHCPHAGQSGRDTCGSDCDAYCSQYMANCTGVPNAAAYQNFAACKTDCANFAIGTFGATSGDSLQCRLYHVGVAQTSAANSVTHCPHAAKNGGGVCVVPPASCTSYCTKVLANCNGTNQIFTGTADCMAECAAFAASTPADTDSVASNTGNTLGCRDYHAGASMMDPNVHCPHARPDSTFCVSAAATALGLTSGTCDNYCDNLLLSCSSTLLGVDRGACLKACSLYTDQGVRNGVYPLPATATGDLACRRYHLQVARGDPTIHCPHADLTGGGVCGDYCYNLCQSAAQGCTTAQTGYMDQASCRMICKNFPMGVPTAQAGDSYFCRAYHLSVALRGTTEAGVHCPHTGQSGSGACGTDCDAYCSQYMANCTGVPNAAAYVSMAACTTACGAFNSQAARGATAGDSLQCRLYHLGVAQQSAVNSVTHCPHAAQDGGGVCVNPTPAPTRAPTNAAPTAPTTATQLCEQYCDNIIAAGCGFFIGGAARASCLTECAIYPRSGNPAATTGNSLECRAYHAGVALTDNTHCAHAGPAPTAFCVGETDDGKCDDYCNNFIYTCPAATILEGGFDDTPAARRNCLAICATFDRTLGSYATFPISGTGVEGDNIACRRYHSQVARTAQAGHCPHVAPWGGETCGSLCEAFCSISVGICTNTSNGGYTSEAACMSACSVWPTTGTFGATAGNSYQCRMYHLTVAASGGAPTNMVHCPHQAANGGGVCVVAGPAPTPLVGAASQAHTSVFAVLLALAVAIRAAV